MVNGYDIVYKWFDYLKAKGHSIAGYVIMPNHVHAMIGSCRYWYADDKKHISRCCVFSPITIAGNNS